MGNVGFTEILLMALMCGIPVAAVIAVVLITRATRSKPPPLG